MQNCCLNGKKECIVIIEDEVSVQQNMVENLIRNGFDVFAYSRARTGSRIGDP